MLKAKGIVWEPVFENYNILPRANQLIKGYVGNYHLFTIFPQISDLTGEVIEGVYRLEGIIMDYPVVGDDLADMKEMAQEILVYFIEEITEKIETGADIDG